jgi:hypothetical protein
MKIVISSGHGKYIRGASCILDEVDEARLVVDEVARLLEDRGVDVTTFHDNTSTGQSENLNEIVDFHNGEDRDLDVSVHFNAYVETDTPMGTEVLYVTQDTLAAKVSKAIAEAAGFIDRGPKYRGDLFFLNSTDKPSILIEVCFVDSSEDADRYRRYFNDICHAIAGLAGSDGEEELPPPTEHLFHAFGKCSAFGGPDDDGVSHDEGLAFIYEIRADNQQLFLPFDDGTGLARRLNPFVSYIACRWDYDVTPKSMLADSGQRALVRAPKTGKEMLAFPADWGPHGDTNRVADLSPSLMEALGIETDEEVEVIYPSPLPFL